jgi:hypothetical protein
MELKDTEKRESLAELVQLRIRQMRDMELSMSDLGRRQAAARDSIEGMAISMMKEAEASGDTAKQLEAFLILFVVLDGYFSPVEVPGLKLETRHQSRLKTVLQSNGEVIAARYSYNPMNPAFILKASASRQLVPLEELLKKMGKAYLYLGDTAFVAAI